MQTGLLSEAMETNAQQYCLRWKYHHSNLQIMFAQLLERESFCDVTLACEGKTLRAHKIMLSACSTYFDSIFSKHDEKDPIVILKDVKFDDIKALVEFMYKGEITVENSQLNTLLQTAEELRIKGLAAVSWRSEGEGAWRSVEPDSNLISFSSNSNHNLLVPSNQLAKKRKIKIENDMTKPKVSCLLSNLSASMDDPASESCEDDSQEAMWDTRSHEEIYSEPEDVKPIISGNTAILPGIGSEGGDPVNLENEHPELMDVIKMTAYIQQGGRRPHFWETSSTKRVMEAIKNKEIEMKVAAELLGVSYGTLYGRYRDAYGCLKHPYRVREFWHEPPSVEVITRLQRKELSLFKAAEILNVTVTTLANYLATLGKEGYAKPLSTENGCEDSDSVASAQQALSQNPDITIVKKEVPDEPVATDMSTSPTPATSPALFSTIAPLPTLPTSPACLNGNNV